MPPVFGTGPSGTGFGTGPFGGGGGGTYVPPMAFLRPVPRNLLGAVRCDTLAQIDTAARFGMNAVRITANWGLLQATPLAALDATQLANLNGLIDEANRKGLWVVLELATQFPSTTTKAGVVKFRDFGNTDYTSATAGLDIRNWFWDSTGRSYVADFIARVLAGVTQSHLGSVFFGGGLNGMIQGPPSQYDGSTLASIHYYMNDSVMQTGLVAGVNRLAAGMSVAPAVAYTIYSGTAGSDTLLENWWLNGVTTFWVWAANQIRTAGWLGGLHAPHPGYTIRSGANHALAGYRQDLSQGTDMTRQMDAYKGMANVWPYSAWADEVDATPQWQYLLTQARTRGIHRHAMGEPIGALSSTDVDRVWGSGTGFQDAGAKGLFYPDATALDTAQAALTGVGWGVLRTKLFGYDALTWRVVEEIKVFTDWLTANAATGMVGEVGWPNTTDSAAWNTLARQWFAHADSARLWVTTWASGSFWGTSYNLGQYVDSGGGVISTSQGNTAITRESPNPESAVYHRGTNLAGAEFGHTPATFSNGNVGVLGTAYKYPSLADMQYLYTQGVRTVRLPFRWERLQPTLLAALNVPELGRIQAAVTNAAIAGLKVILDLHNYARYRYLNVPDGLVYSLRLSRISGIQLAAGVSDDGVSQSGTIGQEYLQDVWGRLSAAFTANTTVVGYDLMNEPHDLTAESSPAKTPAQVWELISNTLANYLRTLLDPHALIVEGYDWAHVHTWSTTHPAGWITATAPVVYEGHHYWDVVGGRSALYAASYATELARAVSDGF